jgi:hypothetical protein
MAKSISISVEHEFVSGRGESETVREALAWLNSHMASEDEETGETTVPFTPGDLIVYAVRRLRALHKDGKRYASGKIASRLYATRLDNVSDKVKVSKKLAGAVETIHEVAAANGKPAPKKETKKAPAAKPAPKKETKKARKAAK